MNTNPLLQTDGYNFLMDLVQIPNLRSRALQYLLRGSVFYDARRRMMSREQKVFAAFGVLVVAYVLLLSADVALSVSLLLGGPLHDHLPALVADAVEGALMLGLVAFFVLPLLKEAGIARRPAS